LQDASTASVSGHAQTPPISSLPSSDRWATLTVLNVSYQSHHISLTKEKLERPHFFSNAKWRYSVLKT
jgi:hypothetical protein